MVCAKWCNQLIFNDFCLRKHQFNFDYYQWVTLPSGIAAAWIVMDVIDYLDLASFRLIVIVLEIAGIRPFHTVLGTVFVVALDALSE
jgi:hypothetical protein